jgi:hypothetical protein
MKFVLLVENHKQKPKHQSPCTSFFRCPYYQISNIFINAKLMSQRRWFGLEEEIQITPLFNNNCFSPSAISSLFISNCGACGNSEEYWIGSFFIALASLDVSIHIFT